MKIHSPDPFVLTPLPLPRAFGAVMEKYISMQRGGGRERVFRFSARDKFRNDYDTTRNGIVHSDTR